MSLNYCEELTRYGMSTLGLRRYEVRCLWRPPKDHWRRLGSAWREVVVTLMDDGAPHGAAIEACLYLIATRRGQAKADLVVEPELVQHHTNTGTFNWSHYDGVVTWGADIVGEH
jgi:hypothetical protein